MNLNKLGEFFQQEDGSFDAVHFAYMTVVIVGAVLTLFLTIANKEFPDVPQSLLGTVALVIGAKLVQRPMENKSVVDTAVLNPVTPPQDTTK